MGKKILIGLAIFIGIILILLLGGYIYLQTRPGFGPKIPVTPEKDILLNPENAQLYSIFAQAGLEDALVDVKEKEVLVGLSIPDGKNKEDILLFIYGAATGFKATAESVTVHIINKDTIEEYTVKTEDVVLYADGKLTKDEFDNKIIKKTINA
jgi:hypothetical protein